MPIKKYEWEMTGDKWLDGVIFGKGVPKSKSKVSITVSDIPSIFSDMILAKCLEMNFQADYKEEWNRYERFMDLKIEVIGPSNIFGNLPRYKERRLIEDIDLEFLKGFFLSIAISLNEGIYLRFYSPPEDLAYFAGKLGIEEYIDYKQGILLEKEIIRDISPFWEIYQEYLVEKSIAEEELEEGAIIELLSNEIEKRHCHYYCERLFHNTFKRISLVNDLFNVSDKSEFEISLSKMSEKFNLEDFQVLKSIVEDYSYIFKTKPYKGVYILKTTNLITLLIKYEDQMRVLFKKSSDFENLKKYINYLFTKQRDGELDIKLNPLDLSRNTHIGNSNLARFFLRNVINAERADKESDTYLIPLLIDNKLEDIIENISNHWAIFLKENKFFRIELNDKEISNGAYIQMKKCNSCNDQLVLFSGKNCTTCSSGLCVNCSKEYFILQSERNPLAKEAHAYFCKVHFKSLTHNEIIKKNEEIFRDDPARKRTSIDILFSKIRKRI